VATRSAVSRRLTSYPLTIPNILVLPLQYTAALRGKKSHSTVFSPVMPSVTLCKQGSNAHSGTPPLYRSLDNSRNTTVWSSSPWLSDGIPYVFRYVRNNMTHCARPSRPSLLSLTVTSGAYFAPPTTSHRANLTGDVRLGAYWRQSYRPKDEREDRELLEQSSLLLVSPTVF
jgi:hypothetical protein